MNKMIMMAVMTGLAAVMFVGCGEKDPAYEAVAILKEMSAAFATAGEKDVADAMRAGAEEMEGDVQKGKLSEKDRKEAEELVKREGPKMESLKKYANLIASLKAVNPELIGWHRLPRLDRFLDKGPAERDELIAKAEKVLSEIRQARENKR